MRPARELGLLAALMLLAGCAGTPEAPAAHGDGVVDDLNGELVLFTAASLHGVFTDLGDHLESEHPGLSITYNIAGSSTLAQQIDSGAPADVLATANAATMEQVTEHTSDPAVFAMNTLVIVAPAGNPADVTSLADFGREDQLNAVCAQEVPCGDASARVFEATGIEPAVDTYGQSVTATLNLVITGEVDAALVYATDAAGAGDSVEVIEFDEASDFSNDNLIATLAQAPNPAAAQAFADLVRSDHGSRVLAAAGFLPVS